MTRAVTILPKNEIVQAQDGELLLDVLSKRGYYVPAACGGKGTCGKCKVQILQGKVKDVTPDKDGYVLSCKAKIDGDLTMFLPLQTGTGLTEFLEKSVKGERTGLGIALDIGTTTIGACLVRLETGEILKKISALNPQGVYGADVLSRIQACSEGKLPLLQKAILTKTEEIIRTLSNGEKIAELCVAANTTMLHLFLGVDPKTIGAYPFTPVFTNERCLDGKDLGLSVDVVRLLPSASAYIGSDVTAGVYALGISESEKTSILLDMGTNGEIVLAHKGQLYALSTAAGPAFEGACIDCGLGGVDGAIDKVFVENGKIAFSTINHRNPKGICGSGLIDLIALLFREKIIDENGTWDEESCSPFVGSLVEDKFYLTENIYLSQKDIRQVQLAKSAIKAGIETLLEEKTVLPTEVEALYIAGGLGYYLDVNNAVEIGLLPKGFADKSKSVGNSSLAGAKLCLLKENAIKKINEIAKNTEIIELSFSAVFQEKYVENMSFGE